MDLGVLSSARIVDLSLTVSERLPGTWPGHMHFAHHNWNWFAQIEGPTGKTRSVAPYQTNFIVMDEHCGTHFDAPTHFVPPEVSGLPLAAPLGTQTGDRVPLRDLMGPAAVVDVRSLAERGEPGVSPFIGADHVRAWEHENGPLLEGEIVLFRTGWDRWSRASIRAGRPLRRRPLSTSTSAASRPSVSTPLASGVPTTPSRSTRRV